MSNPTHNYKISSSEVPLPPLSRKQIAHLALGFCWIAFITSWSANVSLELTSVASATILSSVSGTLHAHAKLLITATDVSFIRAIGFFTLIIGRIFRVETLGLVKIGAVIMR